MDRPLQIIELSKTTLSDVSITRRGFIVASAIAATGMMTGCKINCDEVVKEFPLGVASGEATDTSVQLWSRYSGGKSVRLMIWNKNDVDLRNPLADVPVVLEDGGFAHLQITQLNAGERYVYSFTEVDGSRPTGVYVNGEFRAALAPESLEPVRFAAGSCASNELIPFTLERAGLREDLDAFLFLGDTSYNDGSETVAEYRKRWSKNLKKKGFRRVRARNAVMMTWDDHEITNNWDPENIDPAVLANGTHTYFEHNPLRRLPSNPNQLWRKHSWGRTVDVFVLDSRSERLPSTRTTDQAQYIGPEQMAWLKTELASSSATFKLIMNSVPISKFPGIHALGEPDKWPGYPAQRNEILNFIEGNDIPGVVWLGGDVHFAACGRVSESGPGSESIEITVGPFAQVGNPAAIFLPRDQFDWSTPVNNYAELNFLPATGEVEVVYFGDLGNQLYKKRYQVA
ncbi:Alkaline phosphatase D [BD1-7 clade bacterium]|uniref:Alkaline phosphatase D n=1 Tax=BD1-7 clade bacterium TaxID=2029982 RepID=A0A5S9Q5R2_9GAMM|nr:Alkaline phosphatase D [BD1-7 clade bacterium]